MITRLLVANRAEIAMRVFHTCRKSGIETVAVYSDADSSAPHVDAADVAVRLPGNSPSDTYLRSDLIVRAALDTGADAVHPGYGFLSENADFARAVIGAGLTWVGPEPMAIETMGSKVDSKRLLSESGVPVLPELKPDEVTEDVLPVLVKASLGGGGRGMRAVRSLAELSVAVHGAQREAESAFGDSTVFCERYIQHGRHIEVQLVADEHGTVCTVGERECSIQRRHQKVLEEAPSPLVDAPMRARLFEAARKAAKAVDYVGAGTVEFLATESGEFYFLEMNTRLQVEHPVTECTTGLDLVEMQLRVAEGRRIDGDQPGITGHAVEARLYAEDPAKQWQPQTGELNLFEFPASKVDFRNPQEFGIRVDSGVATGSAVTVYYDPMLAKVIAWGADRESAIRLLANALATARIHGLVTNRDFLVNVLRNPEFIAGNIDTGFIDEVGLSALAEPLAGCEATRMSALAAALAEAASNRAEAEQLAGVPSGWRNIAALPQRKRYSIGEDTHDIAYRLSREGLDAEGYDDTKLISLATDRVVLEANGKRIPFNVARYEGGLVHVDSPLGSAGFGRQARFREPSTEVAPGSLLAPMPATVSRIAVSAGDKVENGQPLLWLEAMKMEHAVSAPADGIVTELPVTQGQQVVVGTVLAVVGDNEE